MKWTPAIATTSRMSGADRAAGMRMGGLGLGGLLLVLVLSWATGVDFLSLVGPDAVSTGPSVSTGTAGGELRTTPEEEKLVDFVDAVMKDAQEMWQAKLGGRYQPTRAVVFRDAIQSACGSRSRRPGPSTARPISSSISTWGSSASCASGSGRRAISPRPTCSPTSSAITCSGCSASRRRCGGSSSRTPTQENALSVRLELQADCLAGVWGHQAAQPGRAAQGKVELETGDLEEGLNAAASIGDDRIQRMSGGRVAPDRFTHGSSEQRVTWFRRGLQSGNIQACETFQ